uniref:Protein kinase domain-containing protein n=1 Tax=Trichuris muris TaxID=70415 RepID=A0A5S6QDB8_TRIMR
MNPNVHDREIELLTCLDHPNIVRLFGFYFRDSKANPNEIVQNMLLECMPGDLFSLFTDERRRGVRLSNASIQAYCFQLFRGLAYLHDRNICHRDIKPTNLLISKQPLMLKISDFGCAKENVSKEESTSYMCSRYYRAPELILGYTKYSEAIDIWAAGCVLGECFTCTPIFPGRKHHQLGAICAILGNPTVNVLRVLQPGLRQIRLKRRQPVSLATVLKLPFDDRAIQLLEQVLVYEPSKRLTAWQACSHSFFEDLLEGNGAPLAFKFSQSEINSMPDNVRESIMGRKRCLKDADSRSIFNSDRSKELRIKRAKASAVVELVRTQAMRRAAKSQMPQEKEPADGLSGTADKDRLPTIFEERKSCDLEPFSAIFQLSKSKAEQQLKHMPYEMETASTISSPKQLANEEEDYEAEQARVNGTQSSPPFAGTLKTPFDVNTETLQEGGTLRKGAAKTEEQFCINFPNTVNGNCRADGQVVTEGCLNEKKRDRADQSINRVI